MQQVAAYVRACPSAHVPSCETYDAKCQDRHLKWHLCWAATAHRGRAVLCLDRLKSARMTQMRLLRRLPMTQAPAHVPRAEPRLDLVPA